MNIGNGLRTLTFIGITLAKDVGVIHELPLQVFIYPFPILDGFVKSPFYLIFVNPAKAGKTSLAQGKKKGGAQGKRTKKFRNSFSEMKNQSFRRR